MNYLFYYKKYNWAPGPLPERQATLICTDSPRLLSALKIIAGTSKIILYHKWVYDAKSRNSPLFMEPKQSLQCSKQQHIVPVIYYPLLTFCTFFLLFIWQETALYLCTTVAFKCSLSNWPCAINPEYLYTKSSGTVLSMYFRNK